ncbi:MULTISPECIES: DUF350 domain-containing protein [unclassified Gordonia (in: high G+C Gram-positive bacteria)]|uniref:DUF350 domain-containing protein n=1 Tax=unclassified Gordonia (in: high G+C Gram-positive bacteria) TaxID=2657482 RepID=UPI001F105351|nr:DUF350 domain-containing protein [Gordonia sp. ABSL49_1]MCH5644059.1 DUF350 domain-containing protein [Gordonia sp. ABSL49_1]
MVALLRDNLGHAAAFSLAGIVALIIGFLALDLVTPGRLRNLVWLDHNRNAVILTTSMVISVSVVMICAVVDTADLILWRAVLYTAAYAVLAIAVMMWSFVLIDWLTPGKLGTLLLEGGTHRGDDHPAGWITAAVFVGIGAVIGATLLV